MVIVVFFARFKSKTLDLSQIQVSRAETGTEHDVSSDLVANGWMGGVLLPHISLCLQIFLQKALVRRLQEARLGMDQCLRAPPAELISIASSRPPPPPPQSTDRS